VLTGEVPEAHDPKKKIIVHLTGEGPHRSFLLGDKVSMLLNELPHIGTVESITDSDVVLTLVREESN